MDLAPPQSRSASGRNRSSVVGRNRHTHARAELLSQDLAERALGELTANIRRREDEAAAAARGDDLRRAASDLGARRDAREVVNDAGDEDHALDADALADLGTDARDEVRRGLAIELSEGAPGE